MPVGGPLIKYPKRLQIKQEVASSWDVAATSEVSVLTA